MTEEQELEAALEKAKALCAKVDAIAAALPPKERESLMPMRKAAHSAAVNLGEALRIKKG